MVGVILGHARSGSSELARAIGSATGETCWMEPFHRTMREKGIEFGGPGFREYLNDIMDRPLIKHMWNGLTEEQNAEVLSHPNVSGVVFIYRKDVVQAALSTIVARMTKKWKGPAGAIPGPLPLDDIERQAEGYRKGQRLYMDWLDQHSVPHMVISYEELYVDDRQKREQILRNACRVLGLDTADIYDAVDRLDPSNRYNSDELYQQAPNWDEFQARFL